MFKKIVLICILGMMLINFSYSATKEVPITDLTKYTVQVFTVRPGITLCTGVVVCMDEKYSLVLTCKHCLSLNDEMYVEDLKVDFIISSYTDDLALLVVKSKIPGKKAINKAAPIYNRLINDEVILVGYPYLDRHCVYIATGYISRYTDEWVFAELKIIPGCSGGPIFNKYGELVGIARGGVSTQTIVEPITDVIRFLKRFRIRF